MVSKMKINGSVNYLFIYDVGEEIDLDAVTRSQLTTPIGLKWSTLRPKYVTVKPTPLLVHMDKEHVTLTDFTMAEGNQTDIDITVKAYAIGAISVTISVPVHDQELASMPKYDEMKVRLDGKEATLKDLASGILHKVTERISTHVTGLRDGTEPEEYTAFCLNAPQISERPIANLPELQQLIAKTLTGDKTTQELAQDQVASALKQRVSYYENDTVFIDWSSAVIIDPVSDFGDVLFIIELANLQLLEMRYYDDLLDKIIAKASDDLRSYRGGLRSFFRNPNKAARKVAQRRIEVKEIIENTKNYTKFIGEWYEARVYGALANRLRLTDWDAMLSDKLEDLDNIYGVMTSQNSESRVFSLEIVMLAFIILEVLIFVPDWIWSLLSNLRLPF